MIAKFLAGILEDGNTGNFISALSHIAKAKGMTEIARTSGLSRESLYKSLRQSSKLRHETMQKIFPALGVRLTITPKVAETA